MKEPKLNFELNFFMKGRNSYRTNEAGLLTEMRPLGRNAANQEWRPPCVYAALAGPCPANRREPTAGTSESFTDEGVESKLENHAVLGDVICDTKRL